MTQDTLDRAQREIDQMVQASGRGEPVACAIACATVVLVNALREARDLEQAATIIDEFLGIDDWTDESIAPKSLITRATALRDRLKPTKEKP